MSAPLPDGTLPPYRRAVSDLLEELATDPRRGLPSAEVSAQLERHGANALPAAPPVPAWRRFLAQFRDVLTILLLVATVVSLVAWWIERESPLPYEALTILAIVLLNGVLGFVQERRAEQALAALRGHVGAHRPGPARRGAADGGRRRDRARGPPPPGGGRHRGGRRAGAGVDRAARRGGGPHRGEHPGLEGKLAPRRGSRARGPEQHGLRRHRHRRRAGPGHRHRHRGSDRARQDRRLSPVDRGRRDPAREGARPGREAARRRGGRRRGGHQRHHPRGGAPAVRVTTSSPCCSSPSRWRSPRCPRASPPSPPSCCRSGRSAWPGATSSSASWRRSRRSAPPPPSARTRPGPSPATR